jgi:hypothetical protein
MILLFKHKHGVDFFLLTANADILFHGFVPASQVAKLLEMSSEVDVDKKSMAHVIDKVYNKDYTAYEYDMRASKLEKAPAKKAPAKKALKK